MLVATLGVKGSRASCVNHFHKSQAFNKTHGRTGFPCGHSSGNTPKEKSMNPQAIVSNATPLLYFEYINSEELARRWTLPESWVREQVRKRQGDPLPHTRFGKYVRFRWGSPELEAWAERRIVGSAKSGRTAKRDSIQ
jgi:hypothetical protein